MSNPLGPNHEATRYWVTQPRERIERVVERAGITMGMFSHIKRGHSHPSAPTAIALEEASRHYSEAPEDFMRADKLLRLEERWQQRRRELDRSAA